MALQKSFTTEQNITGNYWRIERFLHDKRDDGIQLVVSLYKDQATAHALTNNKKIMSKTFEVEDFLVENKNHFSKAYDLLKLQAFFTGAIDV